MSPVIEGEDTKALTTGGEIEQEKIGRETEPTPSPATAVRGFAGRSEEEMAAWEQMADHSLAATLLYRMGIEPGNLEERDTKERDLEVAIEPPYTTERIMAAIAGVTRKLSQTDVNLKQANTILYALQTLLTATRVQLQEKQAEARSQPRQHLHIHQHQVAPKGEKCASPIASADTKPKSTPKSITAPTKGGQPAEARAATASSTGRRTSATGRRSATAKRTPGPKKPPHRAG